MTVYYGNKLYHHGIKGQKWGIRRFQNEDGSYTNAGKERRRAGEGSSLKSAYNKGKQNLKDFYSEHENTIKTAGKVLAVAAVAGVSAYAIAHNKEAVAKFLKQAGKTSVHALGESSKRVGNAMVDAALMSVGTVAISKLAMRLPVDDSVDQETRYKNQIIFDTASAGIKEATKANGSSNNSSGNKSGGAIGAELTEKLGAPSKKGIDKQSADYQSLFKDKNGNQRDADTRAVIKSLASAGYDIDQLRAYVNGIDNGTIRHSIEAIGEHMVFAMLMEGDIYDSLLW